MNRDDAAELGSKIAKTWRGGPSADIWAEDLEPLHTNQAGEAYRRLRHSEEHAPSIAKFMAHYNALSVNNDTQTECERCDGSGFVEATPVVHHKQCAGAERCHCSSVKPCHCIVGREREAVFTRVVGARNNP